jgi:hypothetical protein
MKKCGTDAQHSLGLEYEGPQIKISNYSLLGIFYLLLHTNSDIIFSV